MSLSHPGSSLHIGAYDDNDDDTRKDISSSTIVEADLHPLLEGGSADYIDVCSSPGTSMRWWSSIMPQKLGFNTIPNERKSKWSPIDSMDHSFNPSLEGLRGLAASMTMLGHILLQPEPFLNVIGLMGVTIFFVLSGFLITGVLIRLQVSNSFHLKIGISDYCPPLFHRLIRIPCMVI
jgi:hypothetical protein